MKSMKMKLSSKISNDSFTTTEESIDLSINELSDSIINAQKEADELADANELDDIDEQKELIVPKLLSVGSDGIATIEKDISGKTRQLDLLLLKAESYSHFILQNQRTLSTTSIGNEYNKENELKRTPQSSSSSTTKSSNNKRKSPSNSGSSNKK